LEGVHGVVGMCKLANAVREDQFFKDWNWP
jgi:hypothetical protein